MLICRPTVIVCIRHWPLPQKWFTICLGQIIARIECFPVLASVLSISSFLAGMRTGEFSQFSLVQKLQWQFELMSFSWAWPPRPLLAFPPAPPPNRLTGARASFCLCLEFPSLVNTLGSAPTSTPLHHRPPFSTALSHSFFSLATRPIAHPPAPTFTVVCFSSNLPHLVVGLILAYHSSSLSNTLP